MGQNHAQIPGNNISKEPVDTTHDFELPADTFGGAFARKDQVSIGENDKNSV